MENYFYSKERRRFGRQCLFGEHNKVLVSINPNRTEMGENILKNPVDHTTQLSKQFALSEANTDITDYMHKGVSHIEGGWPKDINMMDEEQTLRHRKKIERDDEYPIQLNNCIKVCIFNYV